MRPLISTNLIQEKLVLQLPLDNVDVTYYVITNDTPIEIITNYDSDYRHSVESLNFIIPPNTSHSIYQTAKIIIPRPNITPVIRDKFCMNLPGFRDALVVKDGVMTHMRDDNSNIPIPYFAIRGRTGNSTLRFQCNTPAQDFYANNSQYYDSIDDRYPQHEQFGDQLYIFDALLYHRTNHWDSLAGLHSSGWNLYGFYTSYGIRMYYNGSVPLTFRAYADSVVGDYVHVIFSFYRGEIQGHSISVNRNSSYNIVTNSVAPSYSHFTRYMLSNGNAQFAFVRHRLIDEELTTDQITNYIQQAYLI